MKVHERLVVNKLVCSDCGSVFFSAAARTLVARGERCPKCGGPLELGDADASRVPASGDGDDEDERPAPDDAGGRRVAR